VFRFFRQLPDAESERDKLRKDGVSWSRPYVFRIANGPDELWVLAHFSGKVERFQPRRLTDIVALPALRGMLTGFGDEKGCTFSVVEVEGFTRIEPVQIHPDIAEMLGVPPDRRSPFRNFTPLCLALRTLTPPAWADSPHPCEEFDKQIVTQLITAPTTAAPAPYFCPAGLLDFALPIQVCGNLLAVLLSGQRRLKDHAAEADLREKLPLHAIRCGVDADHALALLENTPFLAPEEIPTFQDKLLDVVHQIERVAETHALEIRKTRDQYFLEELAGRIRQRMGDFIASTPRALLSLVQSRVSEYVGAKHISLLYTRNPESVSFFREPSPQDVPEASVDLDPGLFTTGPTDRDGLISIFDSAKRYPLRDEIAKLTRDLPPPLFLLRMLLESGTQVLVVVHGDSVLDVPSAYAPQIDNLYMRRSFYTRLSRVIQGELDIIQRYANQQKAMMSIMHTAHQPLDGILQIESMIRADLSPNQLAEKWLKDIKHTAEHAQALCGSMAKVFKCLIEQGRTIDHSSDTVDVDAVVRSIAKSFRLFEKTDADSDACRSAFQADVDHESEVMPISIPN
jgi:ligand-binding sensor protein